MMPPAHSHPAHSHPAHSHPAHSHPAHSPSGIGIYVHFPWCLTKCPYCDFHSVALQKAKNADPDAVSRARMALPHREYADSVVAELRSRVQAAWPEGARPELKSIFFGGGTPSLFDPECVASIIHAIREEFRGPAGLEITVECNPSSVDEDHFRALVDGGVNRVSIGVQALDDERLSFLGRLHRKGSALDAIFAARRAHVPRISADLIFGVFRQPAEAAVRDALTVADTGVDHISAYALTIEEGTRFGSLRKKGKLPLLEDDLVADSFEQVSQHLTELGFCHYEISNYARPGKESVHNLGYWMGRDYLGLGCGAFGTVQLSSERIRYKNVLSPERYMGLWARNWRENPFEEQLAEREVIDPETAMDEALLLGLRTKVGVDLDAVAALRGAQPPSGRRAIELQRLVSRGVAVRDGGRHSLSPDQWLIADHVLRRLL